MAEYIDKMEALNKLQGRKTIELIRDIKPSDVIERSEYEYLKKENRELAIKYDNAMNMVINEQENVTRLRSNIDKAIEEMEELGKEMDKIQFTKHLVPLDDVLEILKRNIGE